MTMKAFFRTLFDYKFETYITRNIAGIAYIILAWIVSGLSAVAFLLLVVQSVVGANFYALLGSLLIPVLAFIIVVTLRLLFEASTALVAVAENTSKLK